MKKVILFFTCMLSLLACDAIEDTINENIPPVEQEVTEEFTIDAIDLSMPGEISETITIDTANINEEISNASDSENVNIEEITLDDLTLSLAEDSAQENFDFLDSLTLNIYTDNIDEAVVINFDEIEAGATFLTLPEGESANILSLIEGDNVDNLKIDIDMVTNTGIDNDLNLELVSTILAQLGIEL